MGLGYTYTSEAVSQHALAVSFPDTVALTQSAVCQADHRA